MDSEKALTSYEEAEDFIMSALPMFQRLGQAALAKLDLSKIKAFLYYLGNPQDDFRSVHIAGTNGKGSVSHMLAAVFQKNGCRTGLFTSPHLKSYRERVRINGAEVEKDFVLEWVNRHRAYLEENGLSFFEMSMGLACSYFSEKKIDIGVIETGMGGRLDATNVVKPVLSVITHIGMDHQKYLGDSLPKIAGEKAGIIKRNVPVLLGNNLDPDLYPVFEKVARNKEAELFLAKPSKVRFVRVNGGRRTYEVVESGVSFNIPTLAPYQDHNINTVWYACEILNDTGILRSEEESVIAGLQDFKQLTGFRGRYEILHEKPLIIADTTHNTAGLSFLAPLFENNSVHLHLILGMSEGRDVFEFLSLLPEKAKYYFCEPPVPKAVPVERLYEAAASLGLTGEIFESAEKAMNEVILNAEEDDVCLIFGSIYLVAEIL